MMGTSRAIAMVCASLLVASPVLAQPKPPTPAQKQQAGDLVKQAIAKSQATPPDHQGAIDLYLQAFAIVPLPVLLSNIGSEFKAAQKPVEALRYFCKYLEAEPTGTNAQYASSEAKVLQIQLGNKSVDDKNVCAPAAPEPVKPLPEPVVTHVETPAPADPGKGLKLAGYAVAGIGVIGAGIGFYFGAQASSISKEISNHDPMTPWPENINAREKEGQADENKQIIFLAVGGALVAGGVALYLLGHSKTASAEQMSITPTAAPGTVGVTLSGGF